jgi:hypothetical protein
MSMPFFFFVIGLKLIKTTVVTDESKLEGALKVLYPDKSSISETFGRVVGLGIEKSFSSTIGGVMSEKATILLYKLTFNQYL